MGTWALFHPTFGELCASANFRQAQSIIAVVKRIEDCVDDRDSATGALTRNPLATGIKGPVSSPLTKAGICPAGCK